MDESGRTESVEGLIDDRALRAADQDRLGHQQFAEELAWLVRTAPTPSNVALYGRWGSGKSSVGYLLKEHLAGDPSVKFARFDAFKWTETPLRRHFLSQIAEELGDRKFRPSSLYTRTTRNTAVLDGESVKGLVKNGAVVAGLLMFGAVFLTGVAVALERFGLSEAAALVPSVVVGTITFAGIAGLIGKTLLTVGVDALKVNQSVEEPSSGEQFEAEFGKIIERVTSKETERVVVFVDELDRCTPAEVVETLDTIRTFLDQKGCVFVVAADQHVLEQALTERVRQTTPSDASHPYYSSGSEYLDKVFHYQMSLPPLLPQRLSALAAELVQDAGGVWSKLDDPARLATVLVPTHVTSPRRVKALLNAYVLAYRMLEIRCRAGAVEGSAKNRAYELAKLVCMRVEFPLFAADLHLNPRLPEFVLHLGEGGSVEDLPRSLTPLVRRLAVGYGKRELPMDVSMSKPAPVYVYPWLTPVDDDPQRRHGGELLNYLRKTSSYPNPKRDLVHLEAAGTPLGLDPAAADLVEALAVDKDVNALVATLADMPDPERIGMLRFLAARLRDSHGIDTENILASVLLVLRDWTTEDVAEVADPLADAIAPSFDQYTLDDEALAGTYVVGVLSAVPAGTGLVDAVLSRDGAVEQSRLGMLVIETADKLSDDHRKYLAPIVVARLTDPATVESALALLREMEGATVTLTGDPSLGERLAELSADSQDALCPALLRRAADLIRDGHAELGELLLAEVVGSGAEAAHSAFHSIAPSIPVIATPGAAHAILLAAVGRTFDEWPAWLKPIREEAVASENEVALVTALVSDLWSTVAQDPAVKVEPAVFAALTRLHPDPGDASRIVAAGLVEALSQPVQTEDDAKDQRGILQAAAAFVSAGLLAEAALADAAIRAVGAWAETTVPSVPQSQQQRVTRRAAIADVMKNSLLRHAAAASADVLSDVAQSLQEGSHIPSPALEIMQVAAAAQVVATGGTIECPVSYSDLVELLEEHGRDVVETGLAWLAAFGANEEQAWGILLAATADRDRLAALGRTAVDGLISRQPAERRANVRVGLLRKWIESDAPPGLLTAAGADALPDEDLLALLKSSFARATTNTTRERVLAVWAAANPRSDAVRKALIGDVFIPMCTMNKGSADTALDHLRLALPAPYGIKQALGDATKEAFELAGRKTRHENALVEAGLRARRKFRIPLID